MVDGILYQSERDRLLGEAFAATAAQCPPPIRAEDVWDHPSFPDVEPGEHVRALDAALDNGLVYLGSFGTGLVVRAPQQPEARIH